MSSLHRRDRSCETGSRPTSCLVALARGKRTEQSSLAGGLLPAASAFSCLLDEMMMLVVVLCVRGRRMWVDVGFVWWLWWEGRENKVWMLSVLVVVVVQLQAGSSLDHQRGPRYLGRYGACGVCLRDAFSSLLRSCSLDGLA